MKSLSLLQGNRRGTKAQRYKGTKYEVAIDHQPAAAHLLVLTAYCLLLTACSLFAQTLSKEAKVSLITVSPGEELYSSFGHNALWVSDPNLGIDRVYNYGTFDFRTDNFYVKFLRGTLPYQLSVSPIYNTLYGAQYENRSVTEQVLNFSPTQKQRIFDFLENNYLPQNRQYAYKFFYDNCATRLRDAIQVAGGDSLRFDSQTVSLDSLPKSYRQWMNKYLKEKPWSRYGMNLAIGLPSDHVATTQEEMYLPDNLKTHLERAKIGGQNLVLQNNRLFEANRPNSDRQSFLDLITDPGIVFFMLMAFLVQWSNYQKKREKISFLLDKIFFGTLGFIGWFLLLLWVATDHGVTAWNIHLLWALPLHLPFMPWVGNATYQDWLKKYITFSLVLILLFALVVILGSIYKHTFFCYPVEVFPFVLGVADRLNFLRNRL